MNNKTNIFNKQASVFILTMWSLFLLSIYAIGLGRRVSADINLASYYQNQSRAIYLAQAALVMAEEQITSDEGQYDTLNEIWSFGLGSDDSETMYKDVTFGEGDFSFINQSYQYEEYPESEKKEKILERRKYGMIDEERKVSINSGSEQMLVGIFRQAAELDQQQASILANSIIDWRDADSQPRVNGAEVQFYELKANPYPCKNAEFDILEELLLVRGMTFEIFNKTKKYLTLYGEGKININTADKLVLMSLGMEETLVKKIINYRNGVDNITGSEDDEAFESLEEIVGTLGSGVGLTGREREKMEALVEAEAFSIYSNNYQVFVEAKLGRRKALVNAFINKEKGLQFYQEL